MHHDSKIILIVGGAGGIGRAAVDRLTAGGHRVIVADKNAENLSRLSSEAGVVAAMPMDMADRMSVRDGLAKIKASYGAIDAVVIAAAVHSTCPIEYLPEETIDRVMNVNLVAHMKLVRDCLPIIKDGGRIVGVSSIAAGIGIPMSCLYSASKAGLEMFYECLAAEISYRKIAVSLIQPGNVNTGFNETGNDYRPRGNTFVDEGYKRILAAIDSRKGMPPAQVAAAIVRALEDASPRICYVVGTNALKAHWAKRLLGRDLALRLMKKYFDL